MPVMPLQNRQDSKYLKVKPENPAISTETEGGYEYTRPRHTRTPRKTYVTGFTYLTDAEKVTLETFWDTVKGGSDSFDWDHPISGLTKLVRFKDELDFKYVGSGGTHRWNVTNITLKEV